MFYRNLQKTHGKPAGHSNLDALKNEKRLTLSLRRPVTNVVISQNPLFSSNSCGGSGPQLDLPKFDTLEKSPAIDSAAILTQINEVKEALNSQVSELRQTNEEYRKELAARDFQLETLYQRLEEQTQKFTKQDTMSRQLSDEIMSLRNANRAREEDLQARDHHLNELKQRIEQMSQDTDNKKQLLEELQSRLTSLDSDRASTYLQLKTEYDTQRQESQALIERMQAQLDEKINATQQKELAALKSQYADVTKRLDEQIQLRQLHLQELESKMASIQDTSTEEYQTMQTEHGQVVRDMYDKMAEQFQQNQHQIEDLKQHLTAVREENQGEVSKLKQQALEYDQRLQEREQRISDLEKLLAEYNTQTKSNNEQMSNKHAAIQTEYQRLLDALESNFQEHLNRVAQHNVSLEANLKQEYESIKSRHDDLARSLQSEIDKKQEHLTVLENAMNQVADKNSTEYKTIRSQYEDLHAEVNGHIQLQLDERRRQILELEEKMSLAIDNVSEDLKTQLNVLQQQAQTNSVELQDKDDRIQELDRKFTAYSEEVGRMRLRVKELDTRLSDVKSEIENRIGQQQTMLAEVQTKILDLEQAMEQARANQEKARLESLEILNVQRKLQEDHEARTADFNSHLTSFNSQIDTLQKRYQQLHNVMVENMEESERSGESMQELLKLHRDMDLQYKQMMAMYESQHNEYKQALQEKDDKLMDLESQLSNQISAVEARIGAIKGMGNQVQRQKSTRIDELAQPKHVTQKFEEK